MSRAARTTAACAPSCACCANAWSRAGTAPDARGAAGLGVEEVMEIRAEEITRIIKEQLAGHSAGIEVAEVGTVLSVGDGIARIHGLQRCMAGELLELPHGVTGIALNLEEDSVGAVLMGDTSGIKEGDEVRRTRRIMSVPVGEALV